MPSHPKCLHIPSRCSKPFQGSYLAPLHYPPVILFIILSLYHYKLSLPNMNLLSSFPSRISPYHYPFSFRLCLGGSCFFCCCCFISKAHGPTRDYGHVSCLQHLVWEPCPHFLDILVSSFCIFLTGCVGSGCHNKNHSLHNKCLFLTTILKAGKSKIRVPPWSGSVLDGPQRC